MDYEYIRIHLTDLFVKKTFFLWIFLVLSYSGISKSIDSLIVEYGGGMTGQVTQYKIIQNRIYKSSYRLVRSGQSQMTTVSSRQLKQIYKKTRTVLEKNQGFDKPGNMYRSVILYADGKQILYKWGESSFDPPVEVKNLYDQIFDLVSELKFR